MINFNNKTVTWKVNLREMNMNLSNLMKEEKQMNIILRTGKEGDPYITPILEQMENSTYVHCTTVKKRRN